MHSVIIQLRQQLGQNLPPHAATQHIAPQPMLLHSHGNLPQMFGGNYEQFNTQCEMFMVGIQVEFATDCPNLTFALSLRKEVAAKWAISFTEGNDPVLDNYQNFLYKLKGHFGDPIQRSKSQ